MQNCNSKGKSDLKIRSYKFSLDIIRLTDDLPNKRSAWVIQDQLIRSATSIGANLIEARASSSRLSKETIFNHHFYCNFLFLAKFHKNFFTLTKASVSKII